MHGGIRMRSQTVARRIKHTVSETTWLYGENSPFSFLISHYKSSRSAPFAPFFYQQPDDRISLYFIYSGSFTLSIQEETHSIQAGQVVLLFDKQTLSISDASAAKCEAYQLSFSPSQFLASGYAYNQAEGEMILKMLRSIPSQVFNTERNKMNRYFTNMILTASSTSAIGNTLIRNRFFYIMTEATKYANMPKQPPSPDIARVLSYIDKNITEPLQIATLVEISHLSESRFKAKFAACTGTSPHKYVLNKKIEEAKRLLADPNHSVTQVCYQLSFSSSQYFATAFKRITTTRPSEYQNYCAVNQYGQPWK